MPAALSAACEGQGRQAEHTAATGLPTLCLRPYGFGIGNQRARLQPGCLPGPLQPLAPRASRGRQSEDTAAIGLPTSRLRPCGGRGRQPEGTAATGLPSLKRRAQVGAGNQKTLLRPGWRPCVPRRCPAMRNERRDRQTPRRRVPGHLWRETHWSTPAGRGGARRGGVRRYAPPPLAGAVAGWKPSD